jgi:hypothetical protein
MPSSGALMHVLAAVGARRTAPFTGQSVSGSEGRREHGRLVIRDVARESEPLLARVVGDVRRSTGLALDARVRWVTPEEQQLLDADLDRRASDPDTILVLLGSGEPRQNERPLDEYHGYWALELPGQTTMIHDPEDIVEVIQEHVVLGSGPSSWPE